MVTLTICKTLLFIMLTTVTVTKKAVKMNRLDIHYLNYLRTFFFFLSCLLLTCTAVIDVKLKMFFTF